MRTDLNCQSSTLRQTLQLLSYAFLYILIYYIVLFKTHITFTSNVSQLLVTLDQTQVITRNSSIFTNQYEFKNIHKYLNNHFIILLYIAISILQHYVFFLYNILLYLKYQKVQQTLRHLLKMEILLIYFHLYHIELLQEHENHILI